MADAHVAIGQNLENHNPAKQGIVPRLRGLDDTFVSFAFGCAMNLQNINFGNLMVDLGIALDVLAAIGYGFQGDWKRVLYWVSATGIMIAVRIM